MVNTAHYHLVCYHWFLYAIMGKSDMSSYQMSPFVPKYSCNPDELSLPLKYLLQLKLNPSTLILAYPKMVCSSNGHFYDRRYLTLQLFAHSHTLSLCLSAKLHTCPFFLFHINMTTVCILDYSYFDNKHLQTIRCFTCGFAYNTSIF